MAPITFQHFFHCCHTHTSDASAVFQHFFHCCHNHTWASDAPAVFQHFLSYLNNLRVKEYCTAVHNLYHYFDRNAQLTGEATGSAKRPEDEISRRYAALNLAALHFNFGHKSVTEQCMMVSLEAHFIFLVKNKFKSFIDLARKWLIILYTIIHHDQAFVSPFGFVVRVVSGWTLGQIDNFSSPFSSKPVFGLIKLSWFTGC